MEADREVRTPNTGLTADLEYDLAHEPEIGANGATDPATGREQRQMIYVATQTTDYDGDYGYDLSHDLPGR